MDIWHLITFRAIIENGSYIKAARSLNYVQSSVTAHIQAIEDFFQQPVFDRIGKRVVVNSFGEKVYDRTLKLLDDYGALCDLKNKTGEPTGKLSIGAPESTMVYRLSSIIQQFKTNYPSVEFIIQNPTYEETRKLLKSGGLDLVILLEKKLTDPEFHVDVLHEEEMSVVMPKDYPAGRIELPPQGSVIYTLKGLEKDYEFFEFKARGAHAPGMYQVLH